MPSFSISSWHDMRAMTCLMFGRAVITKFSAFEEMTSAITTCWYLRLKDTTDWVVFSKKIPVKILE